MKYATLLASTLIIIAVLIPGSNLPDVGMGGFDKLVHIGMFTVWAVAIRYDFNSDRFPFVLAFLAGLTFSVFTEVLQLMVEGRSFDVYDMAADAVGLLLGLMVSGMVLKVVNRLK